MSQTIPIVGGPLDGAEVLSGASRGRREEMVVTLGSPPSVYVLFREREYRYDFFATRVTRAAVNALPQGGTDA